jgi:hypothetical protein
VEHIGKRIGKHAVKIKEDEGHGMVILLIFPRGSRMIRVL